MNQLESVRLCLNTRGLDLWLRNNDHMLWRYRSSISFHSFDQMRPCFFFCSVSTDATWQFAFNVKFYPPDPSQLTEDITRYNTVPFIRKQRGQTAMTHTHTPHLFSPHSFNCTFWMFGFIVLVIKQRKWICPVAQTNHVFIPHRWPGAVSNLQSVNTLHSHYLDIFPEYFVHRLYGGNVNTCTVMVCTVHAIDFQTACPYRMYMQNVAKHTHTHTSKHCYSMYNWSV